MKKLLFILSFLGIGFTSYAQVVFNKVYDFNNNYDGATEIIETSDGNYLFVGASNFSPYRNLIVKLTQQGDTIWSKKYDLSIGGDNATSVIELVSGDYVLCGTLHDTATVTANAYLMKINAQGDSLWMEQYGGVDNDWSQSIAQTHDGGFVVTGRIIDINPPNYTDAWVFKTDSLGNMLWEKQFDAHGLDDLFEKVIITPDSGIVCAGVTVLNTVTGKDFVVKLNQQGDTVWIKEFGGMECGGTFDLNLTADNGFVGCGAICVNGAQRASVYRLDSLGDLIWHKDFAPLPSQYLNYSFSAVHELPNGNFMAAGADFDLALTVPGVDHTTRIRLFEMNSIGDSLWSQQYSHYGGSSDDYLFDMKPTVDGGYIMCGYIINNTLPQLNDVLVIKVDSNGCDDIPSCITGVEEDFKFNTQSLKFLMYPNPTTGVVSFEYDVLELGTVSIAVYNILGEQVVSNKINEKSVDLSNLKNGVYFINFTSSDSQIIDKQKLILQK
jgi:uncharacterized protein YunC (DUF1805 family)